MLVSLTKLIGSSIAEDKRLLKSSQFSYTSWNIKIPLKKIKPLISLPLSVNFSHLLILETFL